jgi:hypothetical protein
MIISTDFITWLLIEKPIDDKTIIKLAKLKNIEVSDSLRKNLSNSFHKKHVQSKGTNNNIKQFLKDLIPIDTFHKKIDQLDISSPVKISSALESLNYLESGYCSFFEAAKLEDSFISSEIRKIFRTFFDIIEKQEKGVSSERLEIILNKDDLFQHLDLNNDIYLDCQVKEFIHTQCSLNMLLYLCACLDLNEGHNTYSIFQKVFEKLLPDIGQLKSSFYYFVIFIKDFQSKSGNKLSNEKMSEELDIELKSFNRYVNGSRKVHIKHIDSMIEYSGFIYFYIVFWRNLLEKFSKDDDGLFAVSLGKYSKFHNLAQVNFEKFKTKDNSNGAY